MTTRSERARREIVESGSPLVRHSLNQEKLKKMLQGERRKMGNSNNKSAKAERKRSNHQKFIDERPRYQFERALGRMLDENATQEDLGYVVKNIGVYESRLGDSNFEITIVEFEKPE